MVDPPLHIPLELDPFAGCQPLPSEYIGLRQSEIDDRIRAVKLKLGRRLVVLGHHYQRDEVIEHADYAGDSLRLARLAASRPEADFIVFCGVHFMAESADILCGPRQQVILPDMGAGCSMADMAAIEDVERCWNEMGAAGIDDVIPMTYINSNAAIKAFCGRNGGAVCTSSNSGAALEWALARGSRVLFIPDEHLGRNTAHRLGVRLDEMAVWDPADGEEQAGRLPFDKARIILWKGHCSVHMNFSVEQINRLRERHPGIRVIVHPECRFDVVQASDESGSTERIIARVSESEPGSVWGVGTEINLVNRLAATLAPERTVLSLEPFGCRCSTMSRVSPNHLLWVLEELVAGRVPNRVSVPVEQKEWARVALDRMLAIG
ncbi:MAG: quinolinate synthase NadA [Vicinamibacterales bacterium]